MIDPRRATLLPRGFPEVHGLQGIPDPLLEAHLKLYEGYVRNVNLLLQRLEGAETGSPEWAELKRRFGFEWNGHRLHELYFENLRPGSSGLGRTIKEGLAASWGSPLRWADDFRATGLMRGVGWAILYKDPHSGRLFNHWVGLHEDGHPAGSTPLLVMDVWEHAYTGMERARYVEAFLANVHWECVEERGTFAATNMIK